MYDFEEYRTYYYCGNRYCIIHLSRKQKCVLTVYDRKGRKGCGRYEMKSNPHFSVCRRVDISVDPQ